MVPGTTIIEQFEGAIQFVAGAEIMDNGGARAEKK